MSAIVDALEDLLGAVWEAFSDAIKAVWDFVVEELIEPIFALFGIVDETIVNVKKVSSKLFGTNTEDVIKAAIVRAVLGSVGKGTDYFPEYMKEIYTTKGQIRAYYRYAELGLYVNGFPDMKISGTIGPSDEIQAALDDFTGSTNTILTVSSKHPTATIYFKHDLQTTHSYQPWDNSLTAVDIYGVTWSDWKMGLVTYNVGPDNYSIAISRVAEEALFWIEGVKQITEGDTAVYTIKCNRMVPTGESVTINVTYAGTAVDGVDYTEVASVVMLEDTDEITVSIATAETANANRTFTITIASIDNTNAAFEMVSVHTLDNIASVITDNDTLRLNVNDVIVDEANTTIAISVKLALSAPSGAFSIGYDFTDLGSIVGGTDYDNTPGTLNFLGTADEIQTINVDIYADVADDDREQFEVFFLNSTDLDSIDTSMVATVTILDGTSDPVVGTNDLGDVITKAAFADESSLVVTYEDDANPPGEWLYWIYQYVSNTYPAVVFLTSEISKLEMLPVAVIRRDHLTIVDDEYLSTENLIRRLGYELRDFVEAVDTNPDQALIDDAYVNFSVCPADTNQVVSKVLYLMWYEIVVVAALESNVDEYKATFLEGTINNAIVWKNQSYTPDVVGVVADEGDYFHDIIDIERTDEELIPLIEGDETLEELKARIDTTKAVLFIYFQHTATEYNQLRLEYMNGMTAIDYGGHHQVALNKLGDDDFTFPVSWFTFNQLTAREQLEVYQHLFRIDFYAIQITELAWYETSAFWDLFEFILLVIAIVSLFFDYTGSTASTIYAFIEAYVINFAIGELIIFIAEVTGNEVLAAIAGLVAAIYMKDPKGFSTDMLLQADKLLDMATDFADNLMLIKTEQAQELAEDLAEATTEAQEKIDEELENREDSDAVDLDPSFIAYMQSVDTSYFPAIQGQFEYNQTYNYDSLVSNYHNQQLQTGVV
ncbi:MAG: Calx-beta domain-containing protein [Dehalococcoidales bacterium]